MRPADVAAVTVIDQRCFALPWPAQAFTAEIEGPAGMYLIAEIDEAVAGFIGSQAVMDEAHITTFGVDPAHRRRGVGERLLQELIARLAAKGVCRVTLEVRASNADAKRLYRRFGFQPVSRRPCYYSDNDEDAVVMAAAIG